jgi:hypothetical protein
MTRMNEVPIVATEIVKSPYSSTFDATLTSVMNDTREGGVIRGAAGPGHPRSARSAIRV